MKLGEWTFLDGQFVPTSEAKVPVTTHALHYGSSVFEGLRAYLHPAGPRVFRQRDHLRRLRDSARVLRMDLAEWPLERLEAVCQELVSRNHTGANATNCYVRPILFRAAGGFSLNVSKATIGVAMLSAEWGAYLGAGALENGVDAQVSSWRRFGSGSLAPMAKIGGQYVNNQWVSTQAHLDGYQEGIVLDAAGMVSEGGGENLFLVRDGVIYTPPVSSSILAGITRDSVFVLARGLGLEVREAPISREFLYLVDEIFMTGTAAEITPVRSVDRLEIGPPGPITQQLQQLFFDTVYGRRPDEHGWLSPPTPAFRPATAPSTTSEPAPAELACA